MDFFRNLIKVLPHFGNKFVFRSLSDFMVYQPFVFMHNYIGEVYGGMVQEFLFFADNSESINSSISLSKQHYILLYSSSNDYDESLSANRS